VNPFLYRRKTIEFFQAEGVAIQARRPDTRVPISLSRVKKTPLLVEVARARGSHHFRARAPSTKCGVSLPETSI
jgi:hypothetical protein